jgi:toxin-antitoxin system PIN domain toxin
MKKAPSKPLLLDVNVLLALAWPNHQFHELVADYLGGYDGEWATCALTQLSLVRLSCNPAIVGVSKNPPEAAALLRELIEDERHVYFDSHPKPAEVMFDRIVGHKQVPDCYLLSVAVHNHAALLTLDARMRSMADRSGDVVVLRVCQNSSNAHD